MFAHALDRVYADTHALCFNGIGERTHRSAVVAKRRLSRKEQARSRIKPGFKPGFTHGGLNYECVLTANDASVHDGSWGCEVPLLAGIGER